MMETRKTDGTVVVDISFPEIEKFDRLPTPEADGVSCLCLHYGRLLQSTVRFALFPTPEAKRSAVPWPMY